MRLRTVGLAFAILLVAGTASAAGGGSKGDANTGKGAAGPGAGGAGPGGERGSQEVQGDASFGTSGGNVPVNPDVAASAGKNAKPWEVSATWETHRLIRQNDLGEVGGVNKVFNYLYLGGHYDITRRDRVAILGGLYQRFLADPGETGFRLDDISVSYTHYFPLKHDLTFRAAGLFTVPVSYESQLQGAITDGRVTLGAVKIFGDLTLDLRMRGDGYWMKYTTWGSGTNGSGGAPNPKWGVGLVGSAEYRMPFHHPLSLGLSLGTSYTWYYDVGNANAAIDPNFHGTVNDTQFTSQPVQQSYRGEIFVRYIMPEFAGFKTDLAVALANGDPTLGSVGVLHDGVSHVYLGYRQTAEVYGALTLRY